MIGIAKKQYNDVNAEYHKASQSREKPENFDRKLSVKKCPSCHVDCKVFQSRIVQGKVIRIRRCHRCGAKWSTIETLI